MEHRLGSVDRGIAVRQANESLVRYEATKKEVTDEMWKMILNCEALVLKYIEDKIYATQIQVLGRGIIIGTGIASIFLYNVPVLGAVLGIGGLVIGYAMVGAGKYLAITAEKNREQRMKEVHSQLLEQVSKFEAAYDDVKSCVASFAPFEEGTSFNDSISRIEDVIREVEKANNERYAGLRGFINKIEMLLAKLVANGDSFDEVLRLIKPAGLEMPSIEMQRNIGLLALEAVSGGTSIPVDVAREVVGNLIVTGLFEIFQGISVAVNGFFFMKDVRQLIKLKEDLNKMKTGDAGDREMVMIKYSHERTIRDEIKDIRDAILQM